MINYKNVIENIIYITVIAVLITGSNFFVIKAQQDVMLSAINKQTTSITNEFKKIKNKKGESINLNIDNKAQTIFIPDYDTIPEKKGLFHFFKNR